MSAIFALDRFSVDMKAGKMSAFDELFHPSASESYRQDIWQKLEHALNSMRSAQADLKDTSPEKLRNASGVIDITLSHLRGNVPSKLDEQARERHDKFNQIIAAYNEVARKKRPRLPAARQKSNLQITAAVHKVRQELAILVDDTAAWLDSLVGG